MDNDGYKIWWKDRTEVWIKDPTRTMLRIPPDETKVNEARLRMLYELKRQERKDTLVIKLIMWVIIWTIWMLLRN